jgi:hypothetical protein
MKNPAGKKMYMTSLLLIGLMVVNETVATVLIEETNGAAMTSDVVVVKPDEVGATEAEYIFVDWLRLPDDIETVIPVSKFAAATIVMPVRVIVFKFAGSGVYGAKFGSTVSVNVLLMTLPVSRAPPTVMEVLPETGAKLKMMFNVLDRKIVPAFDINEIATDWQELLVRQVGNVKAVTL